MFVLSMLNGGDQLSWQVLGVYSSSDKASRAILNHITYTKVYLTDYERIEFDGEIFYGYDTVAKENVTFMIEPFDLDETDV